MAEGKRVVVEGGITAVVDHKAAVENGIKSDKRRSHGRI